jgi:hypothetical protein
MKYNEKDALAACVEVKEAVDNILEQWYDLAELYEAEANVAVSVARMKDGLMPSDEEIKEFQTLLDQHRLMTQIIRDCDTNNKNLEQKGGEA